MKRSEKASSLDMSNETGKFVNNPGILIIFLFGIFLLFGIILGIGLTSASPPSFGENAYTNNTVIEDSSFTYNFTSNLSAGADSPGLNFTFQAINSSVYTTQPISFFYWFSLNSSSGLMTVNASKDNNTGRYNISVFARDGDGVGESRPFYFIINATNDFPAFTNISNVYNITTNMQFVEYINASDEENHFPLVFNVSFFNNCSRFPMNTRTNCSLFTILNASNSSGIINITAPKTDAGTYWANVTVMDAGATYSCPYGYCLANYSQNRTTLYSTIVTFNVFPAFEINVSNCQNRVFLENSSNTCNITIISRGFGDVINISSNSRGRNYDGYVINSSWFYASRNVTTFNYTANFTVNITPGKSEIGNWTINLSGYDWNNSDSSYDFIYLYVNRTYDDVPRSKNISNFNASTGVLLKINITAYDDDNLIPDKLQGYNESLNFSVNITNLTNPSQSFNYTNYNFTIQIVNHTINGTNRTEAKIEFTPNSTIFGDYVVNITVTDKENNKSYMWFNLSIFWNHAPNWSTSMTRNFVIFENNLTTLNLSTNVSDIDGNSINFTNSSNNDFPSMNINRTNGFINFTANDSDVGFHIVTINATDGYLINSTTINFTVLNVNDTPVLGALQVTNASIGSNKINASQENYTIIYLYVYDDDFKIPESQKSYYNENITITMNISGPNGNLFNFTKSDGFPVSGGNLVQYQAIFTPNQSDIGSYQVYLNVSDNSGLNVSLQFNVTVFEVLEAPVFRTLLNQSTAVNRSLYYHISAVDSEDGDSLTPGNTKLTFNYSFLSGSNFINNNQSIFNITSGELSYSFNSSEAGKYRLNITVNDTNGYQSSSDFWIFVYDRPVVIIPSSGTKYYMVENNTYVLNFTLNHTVQDNLTCEFYIQRPNGTDVLKYNISQYGNATNFNLSFFANFTDQTNGVRNLTLIAYPSNTNLSDVKSMNVTARWNLTINNSNQPVLFSGSIGGSLSNLSGGSPQIVTLSDYFIDADASDVLINQTIKFVYSVIPISGTIEVSVTDWQNGSIPKMTFSATAVSSANYTITAYEYNESDLTQIIGNITSNVFTVELSPTTETVQVTTPSSGGGSASVFTSVPFAFKIIAPSKVSAYAKQKIMIPLKLSNKGNNEFKDISIIAQAYKGGKLSESVRTSFDNSYFKTLKVGETQNIILTAFFDTDVIGDYELLVNATSKTPSYSDWSKIYINLQRINESDVRKYILFTEEYLVQNPNCLELKEMLNEANKLFEQGNYADARAKSEEAITKCKEYMEQVSLPKKRGLFGTINYFVIATIISIFAGISYYYFRRIRLRKMGV